MKTNRRNFIRTGVLAGTAIGIVPTQLMASSSEDLQLAPFKQAPLPYAYGALEPIIDAMTMEIHYTKHAAAYTKNLNDAYAAEVKNGQPSLEDILKNSSNYSMKMRNNGGGHFNHELFWKCMQPSGGALQDGLLKEAIQRDLGGYDQMKNKLTEAAMTRFGSGWAWIYLDNNKRLQIGSTPNQDNPLMDASPIKGFPILGLDVWEHAYYLKYQNRRADYVSNWFGLVNWKMVEQQYETGWKRTL
jgi:Fe-Mn family superoxide dismutase